ncbi:hypothetical protein GCM10022631_02210 [Deinococcus rubellus]
MPARLRLLNLPALRLGQHNLFERVLICQPLCDFAVAISGDARVKGTTRQRVIEHCQQTGYTPSFSGRSLSTGRSFTLHVVSLSDDGHVGRFLSDFLLSASRAAKTR